MIKKIRTFFILSSLLGILSIFSAFSFSPQQQTGFVGSILSNVKGTVAKSCPMCTAIPQIQSLNTAVQAVDEKLAAEEANQPPAQEYVIIQGRYYLKSPHKVYLVNGVRTYFEDNGQTWYQDKKTGQMRSTLERMLKPQQLSATEKNYQGLENNPLAAYGPENMAHLMNKLREAKAGLQQHAEVLKQLDRETDGPSGSSNESESSQ